MAVLRLFASAREAAGLSVDRIDADTVAEVLDEARRRYGEQFSAVLTHSRVWVNGHPADVRMVLREGDVVAVLPPVSGGADTFAAAPQTYTETPQPAPRPASTPTPTSTRTERLAEPLPFAKPGSDKSASGWYRPPDVTADDVEGALARSAPAPELRPSEAPGPLLNGDRAKATAPAPREPLTVVPTTDKPHVRLGLAYAFVTVIAVAGGQVLLGVWMAVLAGVAAAQVTKVWLSRGERPVAYLGVAGAGFLPLAAIGGLATINILFFALLVALLITRMANPTRAPSRDVALTMMIALPIGLATASPVLLRDLGVAAPLALLGMAAFHDVGAYLVGTGSAAEWEGPVAGMAAIFCVTLFVAVLVPDFEGGLPFLLGLMAIALAPLGPLAASIILGDRSAPAPGLRRIDSLLLIGPVWAWTAAALMS
jgi:MoaD family protein